MPDMDGFGFLDEYSKFEGILMELYFYAHFFK
jgi:hypothetical protein